MFKEILEILNDTESDEINFSLNQEEHTLDVVISKQFNAYTMIKLYETKITRELILSADQSKIKDLVTSECQHSLEENQNEQ